MIPGIEVYVVGYAKRRRRIRIATKDGLRAHNDNLPVVRDTGRRPDDMFQLNPVQSGETGVDSAARASLQTFQRSAAPRTNAKGEARRSRCPRSPGSTMAAAIWSTGASIRPSHALRKCGCLEFISRHDASLCRALSHRPGSARRRPATAVCSAKLRDSIVAAARMTGILGHEPTGRSRGGPGHGLRP